MMALRDPDIRLMLRVREGDTHAFAELVEQYQHRLVAVMHHLVGNAEEAEDLAQEVFLRVFRNRAAYTPKAKFSTWLFKIANNLALNSHRDRRRRNVVALDAQVSGSSGDWQTQNLMDRRGVPPTHRVQQQELEQIIRAALDGLNERQRLAVVLNKFEDMGYQEIAEVMELTPKAVKSLLSRAREKLREALQPYIFMDAPPPAPPDNTDDGDEQP
jgi:RNA polymerase sigma-70 factor (ECF subfamily)